MPSSTPPKVVFDTNILISAIIYGGAPRACLELARERRIVLITSRALLLELARVLEQKFFWSPSDIQEVIQGINQFALIIRPASLPVVVAEDPSDNLVFEAAHSGRAVHIVSGDKRHILSLDCFEGCKIVSAATFLKEII